MTLARTPSDRRARFVETIVAARREGDRVVFTGAGERIEYEDGLLRLELDDEEVDRLESLLSSYPVFKRKQPETRKAPEGVVYLSAVTDPKHAADFLEDIFRNVYEGTEAYALEVE